MLAESKSFAEAVPSAEERGRGWRAATAGRVVEIAWLARRGTRAALYTPLGLAQLGL